MVAHRPQVHTTQDDTDKSSNLGLSFYSIVNIASLLTLPGYLPPKHQLQQSSVIFYAGLGVENVLPVFANLQIKAVIGVDCNAERVLRCQEQIAAFKSKRDEEHKASFNCASRVVLADPLMFRTVEPATHVSICTRSFTVMSHLVNAAALSKSVNVMIVIVPNPAWLCDIGLLHGNMNVTTRRSLVEDNDVHMMIVELEGSDAVCYFIPFTATRRQAVLKTRGLLKCHRRLVITVIPQ
jgi:hypothetical protein